MQGESLNDLIQIAAFTAQLAEDPELQNAFRGFLTARNKQAAKELHAAQRRIDRIDAMVNKAWAEPDAAGYLQQIWERLKDAVGNAVPMPVLGRQVATYAGEQLASTPITFAYPEDVALNELRVEPVKERAVRGVLVRGPQTSQSWSLDVFYLGEQADSCDMEYLASRPFGQQHQTSSVQLIRDGVYAFVLRQDGDATREVKCNLVWVKDGRIYASEAGKDLNDD